MLIAALMAAAIAEPCLKKPVAQQATCNLMFELGVMTTLLGECEHLYPAGTVDSYMGTLRNPDGRPGESAYDRSVSKHMLKFYAEGRARGPTSTVTLATCERVLSESIALVKAATPSAAGK